jgi:O-acetyl-ADP-ribose deacetylase (regulator of RNase III)
MNPGAMALCTAYCVVISYRMHKVEDLATFALGDTKVIVRICPATKMPDAQALLLPGFTTLRLGFGVPGQVGNAAGEALEKEAAPHAPVGVGKVVETGPGKLAVGRVYHVAVTEPGKRVRAADMKRFVGQAALAARKANAESLCVPLGVYPGLNVLDASSAIAEGVLKQRKAFAEIVFLVLEARDGKEALAGVNRALKAVEPEGAATRVE